MNAQMSSDFISVLGVETINRQQRLGARRRKGIREERKSIALYFVLFTFEPCLSFFFGLSLHHAREAESLYTST